MTVKRKATKKRVGTHPVFVEAAKKKAVVKKEEGQKSKADLAREIYAAESKKKDGPNRKITLERFVAEAGLTEAGSKTYWYNIQKKLKDD